VNPHDDRATQAPLFAAPPKDWFVEMVCAVVVAIIGWCLFLSIVFV
jgi:hypothetical protein